MGGFLASIFGGKNPTLNGDIGQTGQIAGTETALGEGAQQAGLGFQQALLSGNQADIAKLLAPQIQTIQKQAQQQLDTSAQFGNRSGGTNAANQNNIDSARSNVSNMVSNLTGQAASALPGEGQSAVNTGLSADQMQAALSQDQLQNWQNSILGQGISSGIGSIEGAELTKAGL